MRRWRYLAPMMVTVAAIGLAISALGPGYPEGSRARGDDFLIESKIYRGKKKQPISENTTYFAGGVVYDFLDNPTEVTIFDPARKRLVLLEPSLGLKVEISTDELIEANRRMQDLARKQPSSLVQFAAVPKFDVDSSVEDGRLTLSSKWLTYRAQSKEAKTARAAAQYRAFADWYSRLNSLRPAALPPFARLELNRRLAQRNWIPTRVDLTVRLKNSPLTSSTTKLHSEHRTVWRLVEQDRRRIEKAGRYLASFKQVSLETYRRKTQATANRPASVKR